MARTERIMLHSHIRPCLCLLLQCSGPFHETAIRVCKAHQQSVTSSAFQWRLCLCMSLDGADSDNAPCTTDDEFTEAMGLSPVATQRKFGCHFRSQATPDTAFIAGLVLLSSGLVWKQLVLSFRMPKS
eukprot:1779320-Amphidinium_carterae.1